jgi:uncharacterized protein (TIGR02271 family)
MAKNNHSSVVGVFHDPSHAQQAIRDLKQAGFTEDEIGMVSHDKTTTNQQTGTKKKGAKEKGTHVTAGAVTGVAAGAGVGALWALGIAAGFMPVIGPVVAGGILASVLASAAGGAAIAGIAGALIGLGIPEEDAHYYEGEFKSGRTIVTVNAPGREHEAWTILFSRGAYNRETAATTTPMPRDTAGRVKGGRTVEVHEEQLHARMTPVQTGEVRVRKEVVTEQQTLQVPVTREEVVIERRPASGRASAGNIKAGEEIRIPVKEERVHLEKEAVKTGEVSVSKRKVTDTEQVTGTVRKDQVKVNKQGEANVRGNTADTTNRR